MPPTSVLLSIPALFIAGMRVAYIHSHITMVQPASTASGLRISMSDHAPTSQCRDKCQHGARTASTSRQTVEIRNSANRTETG